MKNHYYYYYYYDDDDDFCYYYHYHCYCQALIPRGTVWARENQYSLPCASSSATATIKNHH